MERGLNILCVRVELFFIHDARLANLTRHGALVTDGFDDVAGACFAFRPDEGSALGDATQCLAEVAGATYKRNLETVLVDVVLFVRGGQDFGLVNVVDADRLKDLDRNAER